MTRALICALGAACMVVGCGRKAAVDPGPELQIVGESTRLRIEDPVPRTSPWFDGARVTLVAARGETLVTYHAQTARAQFTPFTRASFARALITGGDPCGHAPSARALRSGRVRGRLAGGNLALLAALAGTGYAPGFDGAIVVLEDVNEAVYRVDRMLRQLLLAGAFDGCRAIVFGQCTDCPEESDDGRRTLDDVVSELADHLRVPALLGVPVGHVADQWALPLGADAEVDADALLVSVNW